MVTLRAGWSLTETVAALAAAALLAAALVHTAAALGSWGSSGVFTEVASVFPRAPAPGQYVLALRLHAQLAEALARADWIVVFGGTGDGGVPPPPVPPEPLERLTALPVLGDEPRWAGDLAPVLGTERSPNAADFTLLLLRGSRDIAGVVQVRCSAVAGTDRVNYETRFVRPGLPEEAVRFSLAADENSEAPAVGARTHWSTGSVLPRAATLVFPDPLSAVSTSPGTPFRALSGFVHHVSLER